MSRAIIKSYFETGKTPTQAEFHEWIDHTFDAPQLAIDTAEDAEATATAAAAKTFAALGLFKIVLDSNGNYASNVKYREVGCTISLATPGTTGVGFTTIVATVTLTDANADAHYMAEAASSTNGLTVWTPAALTSKSASVIVFSARVPNTISYNEHWFSIRAHK